MKRLAAVILAGLCFSCAEDPIPKPKAFLRLDYPQAVYHTVQTALPFSFEQNEVAKDIDNIKVDQSKNTFGLDIQYPELKGTIYLTYKQVTKDNLESLIKDAQNLTQKHVIKADEIIEQPYENKLHNVFGMFYEVGGNAASQSQFYVTDSINHFLTGSLYFYAKPNYDSIYPAAMYLKNDIKHIMETITWN